jgi:hypothetical protein
VLSEQLSLEAVPSGNRKMYHHGYVYQVIWYFYNAAVCKPIDGILLCLVMTEILSDKLTVKKTNEHPRRYLPTTYTVILAFISSVGGVVGNVIASCGSSPLCVSSGTFSDDGPDALLNVCNKNQ